MVHGNRSRRPVNAVDLELVRRVVELATTTYQGFNQLHLTKMLPEREGRFLSRPPVHRGLRTAGFRHREEGVRRGPTTGRDRMAQAGCLLQVDGSRHDWLAGRGPYLILVGGIDDAIGQVEGAAFQSKRTPSGSSKCCARWC